MPAASSTPKTSRRKMVRVTCRRRRCRIEELVRTERIPAALNAMPMTPTTTAGYPTLVPGTRPNNETASALVNDSSAAAARTSWPTSGSDFVVRLSPMVRATNKRPVSAPAEVAIAVTDLGRSQSASTSYGSCRLGWDDGRIARPRLTGPRPVLHPSLAIRGHIVDKRDRAASGANPVRLQIRSGAAAGPDPAVSLLRPLQSAVRAACRSLLESRTSSPLTTTGSDAGHCPFDRQATLAGLIGSINLESWLSDTG